MEGSPAAEGIRFVTYPPARLTTAPGRLTFPCGAGAVSVTHLPWYSRTLTRWPRRGIPVTGVFAGGVLSPADQGGGMARVRAGHGAQERRARGPAPRGRRAGPGSPWTRGPPVTHEGAVRLSPRTSSPRRRPRRPRPRRRTRRRPRRPRPPRRPGR